MEIFNETFTPHSSRGVWTAIHRCPRCIWPSLRPVASLDREHWLCASCGHCWRFEDGRLQPVEPIMCAGCATRSKSDCIELRQQEFPRFTAGASSDEVD